MSNDSTIILVAPVAKPRMTRSDAWKKRKAVVKYWAYKKELQLAMRGQAINFEESIVVYYLETPKSFSKKKKIELEGEPHRKRPDLDNLDKGLLDALYGEDAHIWRLYSEKRYSIKPRIEVLKAQALL